MPKTIHLSSGDQIEKAVPVIWEDHSGESPAIRYRTFWAATPDATTGVTAFGYASSGHSFRTIHETVRDFLKFYPGETVYRNGRPVKLK